MKILSYLLLLFSLASCGDPQSNEFTDDALSTAENNIPVDTVNEFYQSISNKDCEHAIALRPKYTIERCEILSKIKINTVRQEYNDGLFSVVYLNMSFIAGENAQHFNGYLWLKKFAEAWQIQEDFSSIDKVTYEEFLQTHIPSAKNSTTIPTAMPSKVVNDVLDDNNHPAVLSRLRKEYSDYAGSKIILVDVSKQQLSFYDANDKLIRQYPVSTASKGIGNRAGSDQTPLGGHIISDRFGDGADLGTIFIGRANTGKIAKIISKPVSNPSDLVTSRILWLRGLEEGKNRGGNVDSHQRYIYIHGTPDEGLIGKPASHGCIRMKNSDVIDLFKQAPKNTLVYIGQ